MIWGFIRASLVLGLLAGCQGRPDAVGSADPAAALADLLGAGRMEAAARFHDGRADWFRARPDVARAELDLLARHFTLPHEDATRRALQVLRDARWPAPRAEWPPLREVLEKAGAALAAYPDLALLDDPRFADPARTALQGAVADLEARIRSDAARHFARWDPFGEMGFFDTYPVVLDRRAFVAEHWTVLEPRLARAGPGELARFAGHVGPDDLGPGEWQRLERRFQAMAAGAEGLDAMLEVLAAAKRAGFGLDGLRGPRVAFVEATSKTLLREGQIDFAAEIDLDLPGEVETLPLHDALGGDADIIVVIDVMTARAARWVRELKPVKSIHIAEWELRENPEWTRAWLDYGETHGLVLHSRNTAMTQTTAGNPLIGVTHGLSSFLFAEERAEKKERLLSVPQTIKVPVFGEYRWDRAVVDSEKTLVVRYHVIDRRAGKLLAGHVDVREDHRFAVAYRVSETDTDRATIFKEHNAEREITDWEKAPVTVPLSAFLEDYVAHRAEARPLPSLAGLHDAILSDRNRALARFRAEKYDYDRRADPRFESVVAVYRGDGGMGSGFYVASDMVLTNWHVVRDRSLVELKLHDGSETFGSVFARDARLDVALIKVQTRGRPVKFYRGNRLDLGTTIEVIGHPHRYEFSFTRGVISSIRRDRPVTLPRRAGKKVLHLQHDAATNPGNSGSPVFVGDFVVGIHNSGIPSKIGHGIEFAVHHAEIEPFLARYLPGWKENRQRGDKR